MIKLSTLLNENNITYQNAFLLWMIYGWPVFKNDFSKVLAYSSYKIWWWSRSDEFLRKSLFTKEYFLSEHKQKIQKFLNNVEDVFINSELKNVWFRISDWQIQEWVSILIDFDKNVPIWVNQENYLYGLIEKWLIWLEEKFKKVFLAWVMDSRGSLDFTAKYFTIDLARKTNPELAKRKLNKFNDIIWAIFNYNPRLTQENSSTKNDQFRLNLDYYMWRFWLFTPYKISYYEFERNVKLQDKEEFLYIDNKFLNKTLESSISVRNIKINELAIKLQEEGLTDKEKEIIVERYRKENFTNDSNDEILYSSSNMKKAAKEKNNYLCEFDENHITFISKSDEKNYVEAHHLIPFAERNKFDISIDVVENIVCLCPNCHRRIHLAIDDDKILLLKPLFEKKIEKMQKVGIDIEYETLLSFYKIKV